MATATAILCLVILTVAAWKVGQGIGWLLAELTRE